MSIDLTQRLSFTLARTSIIVVLILSFIITAIQVCIDYHDQERLVDSQVRRILQISATLAKHAAHQLDDELAREVVNGLTEYSFLHHISIFDNRDKVMATYDITPTSSKTLWLTRLLKGQSSTYKYLLQSNNNRYDGKLVLKIDNDKALAPFYNRSLYVFVSGFTRALFLTVVLVYLYHRLLTRPLFEIARDFSALNINRNKLSRIPHIKNCENNELGHIIKSVNRLLDALESRDIEFLQSEKQLSIFLDATPNQVFALNHDGQFIFLNSATADFYKRDIASLIGKSFFEIHSKIDESEAREFLQHIKLAHTILEPSFEKGHSMKDAEGLEHFFHTSYIPYLLHEQKCVLVMSNDITARVEAENQIEELAYFDTLTHLPNKHHVLERLQDDIRISKTHKTFGALLFIDIDNFKKINDTVGHASGDALLLKLASRMQTQIRKSETLARLGGDEFILSVPNIAKDRSKAEELASILATRLLKSVRHPVHLGTHEFVVSASIGITLYPDTGKSVDKLLSSANTAMHQAKRQGEDCFVIFESRMSEEANRIVALESDIRTAIKDNQFDFYLQPLLDSATREMVSAEALLRWHHPERGQIPSESYIGFLENSPMISKVGGGLLDKVCAFIFSCRSRDIMGPELRIAINVSAREFYQPDFVEQVVQSLHKYHLHGNCLEIEITEGAALLHLDQALGKMHHLKDIGVNFALDDFGTGYSSLAYLKRLPIDKIKIDKSFIKDVTYDQQDAMLVASIIAIANTLKLEVVAEGVETEDQAAWLNFHGRIQFQGFLFDKPMPTSEFESQYLHQNPTLALPIE